MDILLILLVIALIIMAFPKPQEGGNSTDDRLVVKADKKCPPHAWFWQEVVDEQGNKLGERICCKHCGPLRPLE